MDVLIAENIITIRKKLNEMKILDLGCRNEKYPNSIGVDIDETVKPDIVWDLNKIPWPFNDNTFDQVWARHIYEHIDNPVNFINEIHRVCKNNAIVEIMAPHASTVNVWSTIDHKRGMTTLTFKDIEQHGFKIIKTEIRKAQKLDTRRLPIHKLIMDKFLTWLANRNQYLCEQGWCYWVGGFNEIYGKLGVVKCTVLSLMVIK